MTLAAIMMSQGACATITPRSANGELYKAFIYGTTNNDYLIGGGTISFSNMGTVTDNSWSLTNNKNGMITCTLSGNLNEGDKIKVEVAFSKASESYGLRIRNNSGSGDGALFVPGNDYNVEGGASHGEFVVKEYTIPTEATAYFKDQAVLTLFNSSWSSGPRCYVRSITVERSGSDALMPEVLTGAKKTWNFSTIGTKDETVSASFVSDNLFYAGTENQFRDVTMSIVSYNLRGTGTNLTNLSTMENALMFIVPAGKGVIAVNHAFNTANKYPNLLCKIGSGSATTANDNETYAKENWCKYMFPYDVAVPTPVWIYTSSSNTTGYIKDIIVTMGGATATIGTTGYTTFATVIPLDLSNMTSTNPVTAYYARTASGSTVTLTSTDASVPAGEGLVLKGTAGDEVFIAAADGDGTAIDGNKMKGVTWDGTKARLAITSATENYANFYVLSASAAEFQNIGTYCASNTLNIPAGKAYLDLTGVSLARSLSISFEDETTGVNAVNVEGLTVNGYYNLSGQRVAQPTKGMYIVNGKKVIIK